MDEEDRKAHFGLSLVSAKPHFPYGMTLVASNKSEGADKPRKRLSGAAIGASFLAHSVVLAIIGLNVPRPVYRQPLPTPTANVWLIPRVTPEQHKPDRRQTGVQRAPFPAPAKQAGVAPAPILSPVQTSAGSGRPAGAGSGASATETGEQGGVRDALRTSVGCDADPVVHLTPGERDRCNQKIGEMAKKGASFSGLDLLKRGRFDAQAEADERRRANREGPVQDLVVPCSEGSNLGGGCLPDSAIAHIHPQ